MMAVLIILLVGLLVALGVMWYTVSMYHELDRKYRRVQRINDSRYDHVLTKLDALAARITAAEGRYDGVREGTKQGKHYARDNGQAGVGNKTIDHNTANGTGAKAKLLQGDGQAAAGISEDARADRG